MTNEKKAEEYAQNEINKMFVDESEEVYVRASTLKQIIKKSHLDGLAEGYERGYEDCRHYAHDYYKPKWHNLREDPNDLPKSKGYYLVAIKNCIECTLSYFNHSEMEFNDDVIAWTELLKFKE